ncbi:MAG: hypothetical protein J5J00_01250 [Deltaproteobacteria bacterium]|nr:hypothetical protein [Deltaproteobacteria bacterium]
MGLPINTWSALSIAAFVISVSIIWRRSEIRVLLANCLFSPILPPRQWWIYGGTAIVFTYGYLVTLSFYYPDWDHFTFWLLDAKIIFTTEQLAYKSEVQNLFTRSSFYPLHAALVYFFSGEQVEQYASVITVTYALLATYLIITSISTLRFIAQYCACLLLLILTLHFAITAALFNFYGEVVSSFYLLLFIYILFLRPQNEGEFRLRFVLLIGVALIFFLIKDEHAYYLYILGTLWVLYDGYINSTDRRNYTKKPCLACALSTLLVLMFLATKVYYNRYINPIPYSVYVADSVTDLIRGLILKDFSVLFAPSLLIMLSISSKHFASKKWLQFAVYAGLILTSIFILTSLLRTLHFSSYSLSYTLNLFYYLYDNLQGISQFAGMSFILACLAMAFNRKPLGKIELLLIAIPLLTSLPIINFIVSQSSLQSNSLLRYVTIAFYLMPVLVALSLERLQYFKGLSIAVAIMLSFGFYFVAHEYFKGLSTYYGVGISTIHDGRYESFKWQQGFSKISKRIQKVIKEKKLIVCSMRDISGVCTNGDIPGIYYRYYLSQNSVGGQFFGERLESLISRTAADYIFIPNMSTEIALSLKVHYAPDGVLYRVDKSRNHLFREPIIIRQNKLKKPS